MKSLFPLLLLLLLISCKDTPTIAEDLMGIHEKTSKEANPQTQPTPLEELLPSNYTIVPSSEGPAVIYHDLNGDGQQDAAALIQLRGDTTYEHAREVRLCIYTADRHGQWQIHACSKNLGGAAVAYSNGAPLLLLQGSVLSYYHQAMRHHMHLKFRYDIQSGDFVLIGKEYKEYGGMEYGPTRISINYLTGIKLVYASRWDEQLEEIVDLPEEKVSFQQSAPSLSTIDLERLYDQI